MTDLGAAIRTKFPIATSASTDLASGYNVLRDALLAVLNLHQPFLAELTSDGEIIGYQCMGCGPVEDWGSVHYPCGTVLAIAEALGIEVGGA